MTAAPGGPVPALWPSGAQARLWVAQLAVVVVVVAAGAVAAGDDSIKDQFPWLNLAVVAAVVSALANGLWIVSARQRFGARRRTVLGAVEDAALDAAAGSAAPAPVAGGEQLVGMSGLTRYHRPGCRLVAGKPLVVASRSEHEQASRVGCGWCRP